MSAKKIIIIASVVLVLAGVVIGSILHSQANVTKVSTGKAVHQELVSIVSGTGQIKPKTYVNIGATAFGRITHLYVKEGDRVKAGATLATVESVQPRPPSPPRRPALPPPRPTSPAILPPRRPPKPTSSRARLTSSRRSSTTTAPRHSTNRSSSPSRTTTRKRPLMTCP